MKLGMGHYRHKSNPDAKLSLVALLVLEIWRHKISLKRKERVIKFGYLSPENGFNFKKNEFFMSRIVILDPKLTGPPCQFQQFPSRGKLFHFVNFWDLSMRKEQQQPPWLINFAKIWSEHVLKIKTKNHKVWASYSERFLIGSCEFNLVIRASEPPPPPRPDRVK